MLLSELLKDVEYSGKIQKMTDEEYMKIAIELSKKAYYPYGAIIVKDNKRYVVMCIWEEENNKY